MKKLIFVVFVLASISCFSQNRFDYLFQKADSAFTQKFTCESIDSLYGDLRINKTKQRLICLYIYDQELYWKFIYENKESDYKLLEQKLKKIKRELRKLKSMRL